MISRGVVVWVVLMFMSLKLTSAQLAPAIFVFGDSLMDVGNNNYLTFTIAKADFPHYGIDFPTHKPTGRFSNGKNAADFLAQKLGLLSPAPYLAFVSNKRNNFITGVNFASAAAGLLNTTNRHINIPRHHEITDQHSKFTISMDEQVEYYAKVRGVLDQQLGQSGAAKHLAKSIFTIVIGSTDVGGYSKSSRSLRLLSSKPNFPKFINLLVLTIRRQLKQIYDLGGRKFVVLGISTIGCIPSVRIEFKDEACDEVANYWASKYNQGLKVVLQEFKSELKDFHYSYFNAYDFFLNIIRQPLDYGFKEVKAACCGLGKLNAEVACYPVSSKCPNRSDHVFWDLYNPTEAVTRIISDAIFDDPQVYAFPVNVRQLVSS